MMDPAVWYVVVALASFALVWIAILHLAAWMSGWSRLAKAYRCDSRFGGFRVGFVSGEMRGGPCFGLPCNYGLCLTLGSAPEGIYLAVALPFRPGHPPLFIPWREVHAQVDRAWLTSYVTFTFEPFKPLGLRISRGTADRLISASGAADINPVQQQ